MGRRARAELTGREEAILAEMGRDACFAVDLAAATGDMYASVYQALASLVRKGRVERVAAGPGAVRWRKVELAEEVAGLEASFRQPAAVPDRHTTPPPLTGIEKLTAAIRRLRTCQAQAERVTLAREIGRVIDLLDEVRDGLVGEIVPTPDYSRNHRTRAKNPAPGRRICSKCRAEKADTDFPFRDKKSGRRRAECSECFNAGQRQRYVRVGYKVVTVEVQPDDICVGAPCPECGQPFEAGQLVSGDHVHHFECPKVAA